MARLTKPWSQEITDYIDTYLKADFESGLLYWKRASRNGKNKPGDLLKTSLCNPKPRQYLAFGVRINSKFKVLKVHQVIFYLYHKRQAKLWIAHLDQNPLNNAITNLQEATISQGMSNCDTVKCRSEMSPFKGVRMRLRKGGRKSFWSTIRCNGKSKYLGSFSDPEEAARAYDQAAIKLHGDFASLNFPVERN